MTAYICKCENNFNMEDRTMADIKLNIYKSDNKNEVEKTYTADTYDLMLGTVEDIMAVVDFDKLDNNMEVGKMVLKAYPQLKPFLKDIFEGLTDEELKHIKVKELIPLFVEVFKAIAESLDILKSGN